MIAIHLHTKQHTSLGVLLSVSAVKENVAPIFHLSNLKGILEFRRSNPPTHISARWNATDISLVTHIGKLQGITGKARHRKLSRGTAVGAALPHEGSL